MAGARVAREHDAVGSVEPFNELSARLPQHERQLPIDPDFRIVINRDFKHDGRTGRVERTDLVRNGHSRAVPIEAKSAGGTALFELSRFDSFPFGIVKVCWAGMDVDVLRVIRRTGWGEISSRTMMTYVHDFGIAVPPLAFDQRHAFVRF